MSYLTREHSRLETWWDVQIRHAALSPANHLVDRHRQRYLDPDEHSGSAFAVVIFDYRPSVDEAEHHDVFEVGRRCMAG